MKFNDKSIEKKFYEDGYIIFKLLDSTEVEHLKKIYYKHSNYYIKIENGSHSTCDTKNIDLIQNLNLEIKQILKPKLDKIFSSYDYLLSSFLTKEPGIDNVTNFHQDPTMIENDNFISAGLWIPLQHTNKINGCLKMIKGSHRLGEILAITPGFKTIFNQFENSLNNFEETIELEAGEAVLFNNKLIHGAHSNTSKEKRIAVVTALKSEKCKWVYFHKKEGSKKIGKYLMDFETYSTHVHGEEPKGQILEKFNFTFQEKSFNNFLKFMFLNYPVSTFKNYLKHIKNEKNIR